MTAEGSVLVPDDRTEPRMEAGGAAEEPNEDREPRMTGKGAERGTVGRFIETDVGIDETGGSLP